MIEMAMAQRPKVLTPSGSSFALARAVAATAHSSNSADGRAIEDRAEALDEEELEELGGDGGGARRADGCGAGRGAFRGAMEEFGVCGIRNWSSTGEEVSAPHPRFLAASLARAPMTTSQVHARRARAPRVDTRAPSRRFGTARRFALAALIS